ncbi:hypothetical protein Q5752_004510 [Cryptotrichosporon argae]
MSDSESDTLLPNTPIEPASVGLGLDYDDVVERPVELAEFALNVRSCRAWLAFALLITGLTGIAHLLSLTSLREHDDGGSMAQYKTACYLSEAASLLLLSASSTLYFVTIFRPVIDPHTLVLQHPTLHRVFVTATFWSLLAGLALHFVPDITFTLLTHRAAPTEPNRLIGLVRVLSTLGGLAAAGSMRRGPKLRCNPLRLGTGYGIRADEVDQTGANLSSDANEDHQTNGDGANVLDYDNCSLISLCTLAYSAKVVIDSTRKGTLTHADMPQLNARARAAGLAALAQLDTGADGRVTSLGIVKTLFGPMKWTVLFCLSLETAAVLVGYIQVWALHEVVEALQQGQEERPYAYLMCWALFLGQAIYVFISAYSWVTENYFLHNTARLALSGMLFAKILRSSEIKAMETHHSMDAAKQAKGRAQVMNLLTSDIGTIGGLATLIWSVTNNLLGLIIGLYLFWSMLGPSSIVAIAVIPLNLPLMLWISRLTYKCDKAWYRARDARTSAIKEFLSGIKVVKLNAFESYERARIDRLREIEYKQQRWRYWLGTFSNIVNDQLPVIALTATFWYHTRVREQRLDPATAFVAFSIFGRIRSGLESVPRAIQSFLASKVTLDRIKGFLNTPEIEPAHVNYDGRIECWDADIAWPTGDDDLPENDAVFKLKDISLSIPKGDLTLVSGPLGSGKSLLLHALLGEAVVERGTVVAPRTAPDATPVDASTVTTKWTAQLWLTDMLGATKHDTVAYAPQHAYVRHGTVRDNIVFGLPFWPERYAETLRACSLVGDIEILVNGDLTQIGEHGVNLSGGQKARVNLARCVYSRASTLYLDDILSAVDAFTAQHIVHKCFNGQLVRGRTVVLVSHHVELCLPVAQFYVALEGGRVARACPAGQVGVTNLVDLASPTITSPVAAATTEELANAQQAEGEVEPKTPTKADDKRRARVLYEAEHQAEGCVATSHYMLLIKLAGGAIYVVPLVVAVIVLQVTDVLNSLVIERWSSDTSSDPAHVDTYLRWYLISSAVSYLFGAVRWIWLYGIGSIGWYNRGTRMVHRLLVDRLMVAPLAWFERTPQGRIMNVYGQDMWQLDSQSADAFGPTRVIGAALVIVVHEPVLGVVLVGLAIPLYFLSRFLGQLRANLRRLNATADSPLIGIYHDAIDGVVIVRAFGLNKVMASAMMMLINRSRAVGVSDWMSYNLIRTLVTSASALSVSLVGFLLVWKDVPPARTGLILNFALSFSGELFGLLQQILALEVLFVSAERANHYIQMDEAEPVGGGVPPANWPTGRIEYKNLSMRYAEDLPDVLHDVSFVAEPGMRVGIVGATGSGKSTLALSLFRGVEARSGSIVIDGIDIANIALPELRARLNMVVQDGTLSSGTLREALDITGTKDDYEIYAALKRVHLLPDVITDEVVEKNLFANLDTFVAVEGANFSHGQRQLLCLARALLKQNKILVMDEATSAIDFETDAKITAAVRECFQGTTMLVIAHRLATIIAYDRVLVLDHGRVKEYGKPADLMVDPGTAFHGLCTAQGEEAYAKLLALARAGN